MRRSLRLLVPLTLLSLSSFGTAHAQETFLLRMAPPAGQVSKYQTEVNIWMVSGILPSEIDLTTPTIRHELHTTLEVRAVVDEIRHVTLTIDSSRTESPAMPGVAGALPNLSGIVQVMKIDTRGQVLESEMIDSTIPSAVRGFLDQMDRLSGAATSLNLPENPVAVGDTWEVRDEIPIESPVGRVVTTTTRQYKLDAIEVRDGFRHALLSIDGTIAQETDDDPDTPAMMQLSMSGTVSSTIDLDLDAGRIVNMTNRVSMEGEMTMGGQSNQMMTTTVVEMNLVP